MTGGNAKVVPKRFTSKFSVCRTNKTYNTNIKKEEIIPEQTSELQSLHMFFFSDLPSLPFPSTDLQDVLVKYNQMNDGGSYVDSLFNPLSIKKKSRRCKLRSNKTKCLNGFLAFRSFYSRSIFNVDHQRQLSSLLGKLWRKEPNQEVWNRYAIEYNNQASNQDFVGWLCMALGLQLRNIEFPFINKVKNEKWLFSSRNNDNAVEDIYYVNSM